MTQAGLQVSGLQASYDTAPVLFDISFQVRPGEVVSLLGRNGMGRSTTIKALFGLVAVSASEISYGGRSLVGLPTHRIARLGLALVPEGRQIFPNLSVEENLVATARRGADGGQRWSLPRVYEFFPRLHERRRNLGHALSGGEQQMLAIGRALMTNPDLLILDEAVEGLAPLIREEIWQTLSYLKDDGLSMIIVDKNVNALMAFTDRHYVLEKGRTVWSGDSDKLRQEDDIVQQYLSV